MAYLTNDQWHDRIRAASSQREVVGTIQDYVADLHHEGRFEGESLVLNDSGDVVRNALRLSREDLQLPSDTPTDHLVREMASMFGDASLRIASIAITAGEHIESESDWIPGTRPPWKTFPSNAPRY